MAHFQLVEGPRLYVIGDVGEEKIAVHKGKKIKLLESGGADASGQKLPVLYSSNPLVGAVSGATRLGITQSFYLDAIKDGEAVLNGLNQDGNDCVSPLKMLSGEFKKHEDMAVDLLAEKLGRSDDAFKIYCLQRLLNSATDDSNLFHQKSPKNVKRFKTELACGSVASVAAKQLFGSVSEVYNSYHRPLTSVSGRNSVKYSRSTIDRARQTIKAKLQGGIPVRVGTAHHPSTSMLSNGRLQPNLGGGHFVLIVGCNEAADLFLYVDPWHGGSRLLYTGGMASDPFTARCMFLGLFEVEEAARGPVIRQKSTTYGGFGGDGFLEVIAGP